MIHFFTEKVRVMFMNCIKKINKYYPIVSALRTQFNWMQYKLLIHIDDADKREYYELEALHNAWNGRELER